MDQPQEQASANKTDQDKAGGPRGLFPMVILFICVVLEIGAGREIIRRALGKPTDLPSFMMLPLVFGVLIHAMHWVITGNMAYTYYRDRSDRAHALATRFVWAYFGIWAVSAVLAFFSS